jgi:hypothetical protein
MQATTANPDDCSRNLVKANSHLSQLGWNSPLLHCPMESTLKRLAKNLTQHKWLRADQPSKGAWFYK